MSIRPTVYILDDDPAFCAWAKAVLTAAGVAAEAFESAEKFLAAKFDQGPSCLLLDCQLPAMHGLELLQILNSRQASIATVMMTASGDVPSAVKALKLGAVDYLQKPLSPQELLQKAHEGIGTSSQRWIELSAEQERESQLESLSPREREVAELLVAGMNTKQIARQLDVSPKTVETHRPNIFNKLGIESVVELSRLITTGVPEQAFVSALQASP